MSYNFTNSDQTGAFSYTGSDLFNQGLAKVIGSVIPGGEGLAGMASPLFQRILGINNDAMMTSTIMSNMSTYGTYMQNMNRMSNMIGQQSVAPMLNAAQTQFMQGIARTMTSEEAFNRLVRDGKTNSPSYQSYIDSQVQGYRNNPIYSTIYGMMDPMGLNEAGRYMGYAANNMIRPGLAAGNRNTFANVRAVMKGMFQDEDGNYNFKSTDYGSMQQGEVAALTAALTKDTDFLIGADLSKSGSLGEAAKRLRSTVQEYAKALSPLKDLFGQDIPGMLQAIEELSGQNISQMGPDRARQIAIRAMDSTSTGRYSMGQLSGVTGVISRQMQGMNVSTMNRLNANLYATRALDYARGGIMPNFMTQDDFVNAAANMAVATANSNGADLFAQAYSIWANQQEAAGQDSSTSAFQAAMAADAGPNGDMFRSALKLAGAVSTLDLQRGYSYGGFARAKQEGWDQTMAFDQYLRQQGRVAGNYVAGDPALRAVLSKASGQEYSYDKTYELYQQVMTLGTNNTELFNLTGEARREALRNMGQTEEQINAQELLFERMRNDKFFTPMVAQVFMAAGARKQAQATKEAGQRREMLEALEMEWAPDAKGLFSRLFVNGGKGLADGSVTDILKATEQLNLQGSEGAVQDTRAIIAIAAKEAQQVIGTVDGRTKTIEDYERDARAEFGQDSDEFKRWKSKEKNKRGTYNQYIRQTAEILQAQDTNARKNYVMDMVRYANSAEGLANEGFRKHLTRWKELGSKGSLTEAEREEMSNAEAMTKAYKDIGESAISRHLENAAKGAKTPEERNARVEEAEREFAGIVRKYGKQSALNFIQHRAVRSKLEGMKDSSQMLAMLKTVQEYAGIEGDMSSFDSKRMNEAYDKLEADYRAGRNLNGRTKEEALSQLEQLKQGVNESITGVNGTAGMQTDVFGSLTSAIRDLTDWLKSNKTANTNGAVKTETTSKDVPENAGKQSSGWWFK